MDYEERAQIEIAAFEKFLDFYYKFLNKTEIMIEEFTFKYNLYYISKFDFKQIAERENLSEWFYVSKGWLYKIGIYSEDYFMDLGENYNNIDLWIERYWDKYMK